MNEDTNHALAVQIANKIKGKTKPPPKRKEGEAITHSDAAVYLTSPSGALKKVRPSAREIAREERRKKRKEAR